MPRADFIQWDRIVLLKLMASVEMTMSSILLLLYGYLSVLQNWTSTPDKRPNVLEYRWFIISLTIVDFGIGSLLAYASNLVKRYRRPKVIVWLVCDSLLLPINIYLLRRITHEFEVSTPLSTDIHFRRVVLVHEIYQALHLPFIIVAINFLGYYSPKEKKYDPSSRPESVFSPTDPQITTTESRRIRFSESFLQARTRQSSESEGSTSTSRGYEMQFRAMVATKFRFYRVCVVPLVTSYWLKQLTAALNSRRRNAKKELKMTKALAQFPLTYPDICSVLAYARDNRKSVRLKEAEGISLNAVSSLNI